MALAEESETHTELLRSTWAQATASQLMLQALFTITAAKLERADVEMIFQLAGRTAELMSLGDDSTPPLWRDQATRVLQAVHHMRRQVLAGDCAGHA